MEKKVKTETYYSLTKHIDKNGDLYSNNYSIMAGDDGGILLSFGTTMVNLKELREIHYFMGDVIEDLL